MTLGRWGEEKAVEFLKNKDYLILSQNFRSRGGEIDIVCQKNETLVFVEVKSRVSDKKGAPYEAINFYKLKHLKRAIYYYLILNKLLQSKLRADVISIEFYADRTIKKLQHFENVEI